MKAKPQRGPLTRKAFVDWLTGEGRARYHDRHPFHILMHEGQLTKTQLQQWVLNRYYYQTRIPIKDALILSKSEDPAFRRMWLRRILDHDGRRERDGGLVSWLKLARGVGLDPDEVRSCRSVLPGVRRACDSYVEFVRDSSLLEAVASSLTELFAPRLMVTRLRAWKRHYPWVRSEALGYFRRRVSRAGQDSRQAIDFVVGEAATYELQERCVRAVIKKTEILRQMLDCIEVAYGRDLSGRPRLNSKTRIRVDRRSGRSLLLYPEAGLDLNHTATEIMRMCSGEHTVNDIAHRMAGLYNNVPTADIERDVKTFLSTLEGRGLLHINHEP